ncbi:hypothetical protein SODALDRAFT_279690 [Sodiomyces alkalinus F11]|uniref:CENP-T/Histone H4 histone fold domain-containing protein n=1 Tax=Sodiomyces alkalinus (strain CBS 110278 / VKM F-3762 / F11) TaxID=1314773 RepID=A0A3N2PT33_SODAK|nr:hypothetical protein SODALDRAFT_279690 [Sodiomyces alkalinus F11]ROT37667.1 hypothetical protein SODALDRAFT_279690 [Sodiomyces alkalinus F11]
MEWSTSPRQNGDTGPTTTPSQSRRATSLEPPSSRRLVRTPIQSLLPQPGLSASGRRRNDNAPTPHAKAASLYIDQRRAALTPGRRRRQSIVNRRESSWDHLRALGRALAKSSKVINSSSSSSPNHGQPPRGRRSLGLLEEVDDEDELPIDRPEMTLPLDFDDDADLIPPRSSFLDDQTLEMPRRAYSEAPSHLSIASGRISDFFNIRDTMIGDGNDDIFARGFLPQVGEDDGTEERLPDDTFERIDEDAPREILPPRESDLGFEVPADADAEPSTFVMAMAQSSPIRPVPDAGDDMDNDPGTAADIDDDDDDDDDDNGGPMGPWGDVNDDHDDHHLGDLGQGPRDDTLADERRDVSSDVDVTNADQERAEVRERGHQKRKPGQRVSKHGRPYPPFPSTVVKRVAEQFARTSGIANPRINKDTLAALQQASDWFFEQVSEDLSVYAAHAGRKVINESDMELVMRR